MAEEPRLTSFVALWALFAILGVQLVTGLAVVGLERRAASLRRWLPLLVSGSAGVLLATACLDILPDAIRLGGSARTVGGVLLLTLLLLFCLEAWAHRVAHVGHAAADHGHGDHAHAGLQTAGTSTAAPLVLGSALHSTVDGLAIAAAFAAGRRPGWSAAIAVGLHELPHRLGDFSLLLHKGVPRRVAAQLAVGAGGAALVGFLAVFAFPHGRAGSLWMLPISAGSFLYIALTDLIPEVHARQGANRMWMEVGCLLGGAALMSLLTLFSGE
jgi:zinc and cadmium transporter